MPTEEDTDTEKAVSGDTGGETQDEDMFMVKTHVGNIRLK